MATPHTTTRRRDMRLRLLAALFSILAVSLFTIRGTYAVFSGTTDNTGNDWAGGSVDLVNDPDGGGFGDGTSAEFDADNLVPGDTGTGCIDVKYTGSVGASKLTNVFLYTSDLTDTDGGSDPAGAAAELSDDLDITVRVYDAGEDCSTASPTKTKVWPEDPATEDALANMPTSFGAGIDSGWTPDPNEVRAFEFTWTLGSDTDDNAQGDSVKVDFDWEIKSS